MYPPTTKETPRRRITDTSSLNEISTDQLEVKGAVESIGGGGEGGGYPNFKTTRTVFLYLYICFMIPTVSHTKVTFPPHAYTNTPADTHTKPFTDNLVIYI